jgi:hypothetical protein
MADPVRREKIIRIARERYSTSREVVEDKIRRWHEGSQKEDELESGEKIKLSTAKDKPVLESKEKPILENKTKPPLVSKVELKPHKTLPVKPSAAPAHKTTVAPKKR